MSTTCAATTLAQSLSRKMIDCRLGTCIVYFSADESEILVARR